MLQRRYSARSSGVLVAAAVAWLAASGPAVALATTINFNLMEPFGNKGTSFVVNPDLTLFARSEILDGVVGGDISLTGGVAGTIFVGPLDRLSIDNAANVFNCPDPTDKNCGVGVQSSDGGGSKGISGEQVHKDESLIFDFASPGVTGVSVEVTLIGLNCLTGASPDNINCGKNDVVSLTIDFFDAANQLFASVNASILLFGTPTNLGTLDFSTLGALSGTMIDKFAIRATEGHFGVTSLTYEERVPEPPTGLLVGIGLTLAMWLRGRWPRAVKQSDEATGAGGR